MKGKCVFEEIKERIIVSEMESGAEFRVKLNIGRSLARLKVIDPDDNKLLLVFRPQRRKRQRKIEFTQQTVGRLETIPLNIYGKRQPGPPMILFKLERIRRRSGGNNHTNGRSPHIITKTKINAM